MDGVGPSNLQPAHAPAVSRGRSVLLWLVLLVQVAIPSSYYLWRADREDERFAWRMFSTLRFRSCNVEAFEQKLGVERPVVLSAALHASWVGAMRRGRGRVIERFLERRCEGAGVQSATLVRTCREVDKSPVPSQRFVYSCASGDLLRQQSEGP
jgi:hypothetical protein